MQGIPIRPSPRTSTTRTSPPAAGGAAAMTAGTTGLVTEAACEDLEPFGFCRSWRAGGPRQLPRHGPASVLATGVPPPPLHQQRPAQGQPPVTSTPGPED